jgi:hypothetical protein
MRFLFCVAAVAMSVSLHAETVTGKLMDVLCRPENVAVGTKKCPHVKSCMLSTRCKESGYGLILKDGTFLKFDTAGNAKAIIALEAWPTDDEVNAKVSGTRTGKEIKIESIEILPTK